MNYNDMQTAPDYSTLPAFYKSYVDRVAHVPVLEALRFSDEALTAALKPIPEERGTFRYATGKWSIKEVLCHLQDAERIFAYRALRFARNDSTELPGFDEVRYVPESNAHARSLRQLTKELQRLRITTLDLFASFTPDMLSRTGIANHNRVSVLNLGYIIAGHALHHLSVLKDRYNL